MDKTISQVSLRDAAAALLDLAMPRRCVVCGRHLTLSERFICLPCLCDLPLTHFWELSHNAMADKLNERIQSGIEDVFPAGERYAYAAALIFYNSESGYRHIPWHLKYESGLESERYFSALLGGYLVRSPHFADVDLIIPVPLHWTRRFRRGYNQAEVIALALAAAYASATSSTSATSSSSTTAAYASATSSTTAASSSSTTAADASATSATSSSAFNIPAAYGTHQSVASAAEARQCTAPEAEKAPYRAAPEVRTDILRRVRRTGTQTRVSVEGKALNVHGAFAVCPSALRDFSGLDPQGRLENGRPCGQTPAGSVEKSATLRVNARRVETNTSYPAGMPCHILLVDDTFTTGSTLAACMAALRTVFPPSVRISVATLAFVKES